MMTYEKAELELIRFAAEDVLATSGDQVVETTRDPNAPFEGDEDSFDDM